MKFVISASVLDEDESTLNHIDRIVDRVEDEIHRIEIVDADLLAATKWYESARPIRRRVFTTLAARPPRSVCNAAVHGRAVTIATKEQAEIAGRLAWAPLLILVEDRDADGVLIELAVNALGSEELQKLWSLGERATPRAWDFVTAGGIGSIPQRIERQVADCLMQRRPVRLVVVCDSDARWPGDTEHGSVTAIRNISEMCQQFDVPLHILSKRAAENYVPDGVFKAFIGVGARADKIAALLRRSSVQRDHFPLKDGMTAAEYDAVLANSFYSNGELGDLDLLRSRIFPKRPRLILQLVAFARQEFTSEGLVTRDGKGELSDLLEMIAREL